MTDGKMTDERMERAIATLSTVTSLEFAKKCLEIVNANECVRDPLHRIESVSELILRGISEKQALEILENRMEDVIKNVYF